MLKTWLRGDTGAGTGLLSLRSLVLTRSLVQLPPKVQPFMDILHHTTIGPQMRAFPTCSTLILLWMRCNVSWQSLQRFQRQQRYIKHAVGRTRVATLWLCQHVQFWTISTHVSFFLQRSRNLRRTRQLTDLARFNSMHRDVASPG